MGATSLVIPEKDSPEGYEQEIDTYLDGLAAGGFYPQFLPSANLTVGIERDSGGNLVLKDEVTGVKTLEQLADAVFGLVLALDGTLVYTTDGDVILA